MKGQWSSWRVTLRAYHPLDVHSEAERAMEGQPVDTRGRPLVYLEDVGASSTTPISVSSDEDWLPYGARFTLDAFPGLVFARVDTGQSFAGTLWRDPLPIDVAVRSRDTGRKFSGTTTYARRVA